MASYVHDIVNAKLGKPLFNAKQTLAVHRAAGEFLKNARSGHPVEGQELGIHLPELEDDEAEHYLGELASLLGQQGGHQHGYKTELHKNNELHASDVFEFIREENIDPWEDTFVVRVAKHFRITRRDAKKLVEQVHEQIEESIEGGEFEQGQERKHGKNSALYRIATQEARAVHTHSQTAGPCREPVGGLRAERWMSQVKHKPKREDCEVLTWFQRDRSTILVRCRGKIIIEWLDEEIDEAVKDGFLNPCNGWEKTVLDYAEKLGLISAE